MWGFFIIVAILTTAGFAPKIGPLLKKLRSARSPSRKSHRNIVGVLLSLEEKALDELFRLYRMEFGAGAARYARHTYMKWKSNEVHASSQTFRRLMIHLPKVMSFDLKCEVLRALRREYCPRDSYEVTVHPSDWKNTLAPLVASIVNKSYTAQLPSDVEWQAAWLSEDNMQIARAMLAESEAQEARDTMALLADEFQGLEKLLAQSALESRVVHKVELPYGTITLNIRGDQPNE